MWLQLFKIIASPNLQLFKIIGRFGLYNAEYQVFLNWVVAVLSPAHHQERQQAEGYAHEVGLHVAGAEAADAEQPLQQLRAHSQQHGQQQPRP